MIRRKYFIAALLSITHAVCGLLGYGCHAKRVERLHGFGPLKWPNFNAFESFYRGEDRGPRRTDAAPPGSWLSLGEFHALKLKSVSNFDRRDVERLNHFYDVYCVKDRETLLFEVLLGLLSDSAEDQKNVGHLVNEAANRNNCDESYRETWERLRRMVAEPAVAPLDLGQ